MKLKNNELCNVNGGGFSLSIGIAILGVAALLAGVIDGIVNPQECNR